MKWYQQQLTELEIGRLNMKKKKMRPLLVGQAPSRSSDPAEALCGRSGQRLAELGGFGSLEEFLAGTDRRNLLDSWPGYAERGQGGDHFPLRDGVDAAVRLLDELEPGRDVILMGRGVARCFGQSKASYLEWRPAWFASMVRRYEENPVRLAVFPHPSGVSRYWNDERNVELASVFLRKALGRCD